MNRDNNISINGGLSAAFYTLGCRVNQYETQAIEEQFRNNGFAIKSFDDECDVYVINTCTVTAESDRKSRQIIRRACQNKKENAIVIVCGCYSQSSSEEILKIPGVDLVLGNSKKTEICTLAIEALKSGLAQEKNLVENISQIELFEDATISISDRTRAFVKIVDGCENHCSYCIIPSVRGKIRSRQMDKIISEVRNLAENGYKEVVLTGIETAAYGKDFNDVESPLALLIEKISEIDKIARIRLGSMEPTVFTESFVCRISKLQKLMPHFHLSLQSGSDEILRLMKRKYNTSQFFAVIERLKKYINDVRITTDIIVGFPGETEELFLETTEFVKKCEFSFVHIFPYSKRSGTPAANMTEQIDKSIKKKRVSILEDIIYAQRKDIISSMISRVYPVLLETESENAINGYTPNYIKVNIPISNSENNLSGQIVSVKIIGLDTDSDGTPCALGKFTD